MVLIKIILTADTGPERFRAVRAVEVR